jgi:hypothetical protein
MGAWGGGIYESDFGCDMRADIDGFMRAPISDDELLATIAAAHGSGEDDDHVEAFDYWLVLADQLERRGLQRRDIFERAIGIIESGQDLAALEKLDAGRGTLARRRKDTAKLLDRLRDPRPAKQRRPLKKPQPLLFEVGEALAWPTDHGNCFSEYVLGGFRPDGWGFGVITGTAHEYGVFARYTMQALMWRRPERPSAELAVHCRRSVNHYGGMSQRGIDSLQVERLGKAPAEAIAPWPDSHNVRRSGLPFGLDAINRFSECKFPHPAPSGTPLDPDEPDQRGGIEEFFKSRGR